MQGADKKENLSEEPLKNKARLPYLAQGVFLSVGLLLVLGAFFVLQAFMHGLAEEDRNRTAQDFVEGVVEDFSSLTDPLDSVSSLIILSDNPKTEDIKRVLQWRDEDYSPFSQLFWFYNPEGKGWFFSELLSNPGYQKAAGASPLKPDQKMLEALLEVGRFDQKDAHIVHGIGNFETRQLRNSPKILSTPIVVIKAVNPDDVSKGFLLAVANVDSLFEEAWIKAHKDLLYMRVQDVDEMMPLFVFERNPADRMPIHELGQTYEFPFSGRNLSVTGVFAQDQRAVLFGFFPFIVAILGVGMVGAGMLYIHHSQRQAKVLAGMNEALESKNFELKAEAEERERLTQAIRDAEQQSRAVIDAMGDIIFETDKDGRILFLSKAWQDITGFEIEQSKGQNISQLVHPQDREKITQDFQALLEGQKKELQSFTQIRVSDGTFRAVELSMKLVSVSGELQSRLIGVFRDIEERRKVERALSDAEKKYRNIVENAVGGIFQMTLEGLYLSANPAFARILGYENSEQLLREVKNAHEQLYVEPARQQAFYDKLASDLETHSHEVQVRQHDGTHIWVRESARAVLDDNGQVLFIEGSIEDVTQRKESEEAIREAQVRSDLANRAKSEFLSNMSHELRTPLNSIIGFSEMIKNEIFGKIEQRSYWEYACDIHKSGQKLLDVINEILDISKIEAGQRQLNEAEINVPDLVDSVIELMDVKIEKAQMTLTKALENAPNIVGEELALKQIVMNLLSNAVKFTPEKGRITIAAHVGRDGRFHLSITDTGIGLSEAEIEKALSPFGQVNSELSRSGSGTGLGLTLVDALVKLHGGEFELFSQKGIGTTATIILPAERVVQKPASEAIEASEGAQGAQEDLEA